MVSSSLLLDDDASRRCEIWEASKRERRTQSPVASCHPRGPILFELMQWRTDKRNAAAPPRYTNSTLAIKHEAITDRTQHNWLEFLSLSLSRFSANLSALEKAEAGGRKKMIKKYGRKGHRFFFKCRRDATRSSFSPNHDDDDGHPLKEGERKLGIECKWTFYPGPPKKTSSCFATPK